MIDRYIRPEMGAIWSDERKISCWLAVEIAVCEAWHRRGRIPGWAIEKIRKATYSLERMREIERETDHDVIAFVRAMGETVGDAARFIHLGLTSTDVVDTGLALQITDAGELLGRGVAGLTAILEDQAVAHRHTLSVGRTHGIHAEPTTFGLKFAIWRDEMLRHRERLDLAREQLRVGKISGAVGTHAHVPVDLEEEVCAALGLKAAPASTQTLQRDRHAFFLSVLAGIAGTLEKISVEYRHLQRTEVRETLEPFAAGNQGSSAMPHKRNPHASERVTGLARLMRGYAGVAAENVALWHERDISHSSTERVIFPDATEVLDFMLAEIAEITQGLVVDRDRMRSNLDLTGGLIYSQQVLLALVDGGMDRQRAYKLVQRHALRTWDEGGSFREALESDPEVSAIISPTAFDSIFDPFRQLSEVDAIYERLGLTTAASREKGRQ
ncbi:MAG: adenylosuccinate lyase [Rhizobiales bacterium]|nr:adenylosuccinate lyase [Hyphomicrobiales bacterium]